MRMIWRNLRLEDFQQIINLARETEKAIEIFVDYIRGESIDPNNDTCI